MKKHLKQLKKQAVAVLIAVMAMSVFAPVQVFAVETQSWQDAYAEFLRSQLESTRNFALRDLTNDGIPELLFHAESHPPVFYLYIHTFDGSNVRLLETVSLGQGGWELYVSNAPSFPSVFWESLNRALMQSYYYLEFTTEQVNPIRFLDIDVYLRDERGIEIGVSDDPIVDIRNQQIYDAWQQRTSLQTHSITEANITSIIYGWQQSVQTLQTTTANANSHPFATALREFFSDATYEKGAYLINIYGAGEAVYAWKSNDIYGGVNTIFWLHDGEIRSTTLTGLGAGSFYMVFLPQ